MKASPARSTTMPSSGAPAPASHATLVEVYRLLTTIANRHGWQGCAHNEKTAVTGEVTTANEEVSRVGDASSN